MGAEQVRHTLHAYCSLLDERDLDGLLEQVYLVDAVDDRGRGEPLRGHDELRAYFGRALAALSATAHLLSNESVVVTGDVAVASSRVTAYHWGPSPEPGQARPADFVLLATYTDELRRSPHGWRIAHRSVRALGQAGLAAGQLPAQFAGFGSHATTAGAGPVVPR